MKNLIICGEPTKVYNFDELIEDQFIDSQCNVLDMEKWKF